MNPFDFFDKVYVISLEDKHNNFLKVSNQLKKKGIKHEKFVAVDGRCPKDEKEKEKCLKKKKKEFEKKYGVSISKHLTLSAASLTIGTVLILREMIEKGWENILILEDDIVLDKNIISKFKKGLKELHQKGEKWDMLYLGCGHSCGHKEVSCSKTVKNKYKSTWENGTYVAHPYDLRYPCSKKDCPSLTEHISVVTQAGGTWGYSYSRQGAIKFLYTLIVKNGENRGITKINDHIDQLLMKTHTKHGLRVLAFDIPIIWHEYGVAQRDKFSTIEW